MLTTGNRRYNREMIPLDMLHPAIAEILCIDHPALRDTGAVPVDLVTKARATYVEALLKDREGKLSELDAAIAHSILEEQTIADNIEANYDASRTIGDKASDSIARFGSSWTFMILFCAFLAGWMMLNSVVDRASFDPYPFILLNLILSTIAALQAPIIMMSQRRQETKDRMRASNDYQVNLKAELEIRHLHEKLDHLHRQQLESLRNLQAIIESPRES